MSSQQVQDADESDPQFLDMAIERRFWPPSVTSQFKICPIPFHFDTYRGCTYGCIYCFARDFIVFSRRNKQSEAHKRQSYLEGNDPNKLRKWIERVANMDYDYTKANTVAFKERMPVKIGATADPFPIIEKEERITYECLKIFNEIDYPVQISTKNPEVFLSYAEEFVGANIALNVSMSFCDDEISQKIEVGAISPTRRFDAIRKLADMGFKITARIQPFILPYSFDVAEKFIGKLKECGVWAFQTEGLKLTITMPQSEKAIYDKMSRVLGFDVLEYFKKYGEVEGRDRVYNRKDKERMLSLYNDLAQKYGIIFLNADNLISDKYGSGCECCGTSFLRNHKIWGGALRAKAFKDTSFAECVEFGKCLANFGRGNENRQTTISQMCDEYNKSYYAKETARNLQLSLFD